MKTQKPRVAIVYDRVNKWGGAERVLLSLLELFPQATLFTSVYSAKGAPWAQQFKKIEVSFLQKIPFASQNHEVLAPLMPLAFESLDFKKYDLVISVTTEAAKGILTPPHVLHICYCLTPTRYLWSGKKEYFASKTLKKLSQPLVSYLKKWDVAASKRPDHMVGISTAVQQRIQKYYNRDSAILFPPVDTALFSQVRRKQKDYYLIVSRLVKYKKIDLAIKAFNRLGKPLVIVGVGRQEGRLKRLAKENVTFTGSVSDQELSHLYAGARALLFPQEEDFGIVALEAQAVGVPVIAYKKGGALDTVVSQVTGVFFDKQTVSSMMKAISLFDSLHLSQRRIKENAARFSKDRFLSEFATMIEKL